MIDSHRKTRDPFQTKLIDVEKLAHPFIRVINFLKSHRKVFKGFKPNNVK